MKLKLRKQLQINFKSKKFIFRGVNSLTFDKTQQILTINIKIRGISKNIKIKYDDIEIYLHTRNGNGVKIHIPELEDHVYYTNRYYEDFYNLIEPYRKDNHGTYVRQMINYKCFFASQGIKNCLSYDNPQAA